MFRKALWNGLANLFAFLLVLSIAVGSVLEANRGAVDAFFGTNSLGSVFVPDEPSEDEEDPDEEPEEGEEELLTVLEYSTFLPDEEFVNEDDTVNTKELIKAAVDIGRRHETEGAVLLKNNNNALPLAKGPDTKVTLLGTYAYNFIAGSNQGQISNGNRIDLVTALSGTSFIAAGSNEAARIQFSELLLNGDGVAAGAGFTVNPNYTGNYSGSGQNKGANKSYTVGEKAPSTLTAEFTSSFANYNDAAIVVLGRGSGESNDYWKGGLAASEKDEAAGITEPLELTKNEKDLLTLAKQNFDKVIVLLNTNSAMEIGDLKNDAGIDAILWIGHPANYGMLGVADILCGNANPSGGLYDIYATTGLSAPAMQNMGDYVYTNASDTKKPNGMSTKQGAYVMELESIYVGYRYYETRYFDAIYNQGNAKSTVGTYASTNAWDYAAEVAYGFGYGLGYTTFSYEIVGDPYVEFDGNEAYAGVNVKVTNTGTVAGRTSVQIYGQAPYTQYDKDHLVEKSAIQLLNFDKTDILEPNEDVEISIRIDMQNFASYDMTYENENGTVGSYILDAGDYYFAVGNGAHDALNNVLALQGKTVADGMDYAGNAAAAKKWTYNYTENNGVDGTTFGLSKTGEQLQNQIPYSDWNYFGGTQYDHLTRQDWAGTYPEEDIKLTAPQKLIEFLSGEIIVGESDGAYYGQPHTNDDVSKITWDAEKEYNWYDLGFSDWDDPRWDVLINQLNLREATAFAGEAGNPFMGMAAVGFDYNSSLTENAGNGLNFALSAPKDGNVKWKPASDDPFRAWNFEVFGSAPLVASSFDKQLMYDIGHFVGNEAIFAGLPILWGPGLNTHRHAYNGRNGEYYSEDPVLSGYAALNFSVAARRKGLIAAAKHFVFNDQETNRGGVSPFLTEQRAREIELRAYQIGIEAVDYDGYGMIGLMTSFSKVGGVEVTNSWGMLTGILQQEWGFTGYAVTDIVDDQDLYMGMVYAGCTGFDLRMKNYRDIAGFEKNYGTTQAQTAVSGKMTVTADMFAKDATMQEIVRRSVKRTLWVFTQSNLMNRYRSTLVENNIPTEGGVNRPEGPVLPGHYEPVEYNVSWRIMYKSMIGVSAGLAGLSVLLYVASTFMKKEGN